MLFAKPAAVLNKKKYTMAELLTIQEDGVKWTPPNLANILAMFENSSGAEPVFGEAGPAWERGAAQPAKAPLAPGAVAAPPGGERDMWKRGQILVGGPPQDQHGGGGRQQTQQGFIPRAGAPKALAVSENRWVPGKENSKQAIVSKQVKGILNKMTPQRFEKLSQQLCDIPMESTDMQSELIALVFEKVSSWRLF
jgi:hypothetical protein